MAFIKNRAERDFRLSSGTNEQRSTLDFTKIKVGKETLEGDLSYLLDKIVNQQECHKIYKRRDVEKALFHNDACALRKISEYFFNTSGIYNRLCRYMAYLYRYDYFVTPIIYDDSVKDDKIIDQWFKAVTILDNSDLKKQFGDIALAVVKYGCYYGYRRQSNKGAFLQDLPISYCRSRFKVEGVPVVEFNMKYFDDNFSDMSYRLRVLKTFDKEIQKAYVAYKKGTLPKDYPGDTAGWYMLKPEKTVKFNLSNSDLPIFAAVIPNILDLDEAKDLDKEKMRQQLLRIIVQEMPLDKNGDMIFDLDEAAAMHQNAVAMLGKAIGVNVLTTFADVDSIDMSDKGNMSAADQLEKVERSVYNEAGVSQMQFNTSTNLALEKSIANDEASMSDLIRQFEDYAESLIKEFNKSPKRLLYKVQILPTTIYNYQNLAKLYKEQTMIGFSKLLPQVALGQSQLVVMSTAYFENKLLNLDELFVPPQISSTMSTKTVSGDTEASGGEAGGRPTLSDDEKSEKTIANQESG